MEGLWFLYHRKNPLGLSLDMPGTLRVLVNQRGSNFIDNCIEHPSLLSSLNTEWCFLLIPAITDLAIPCKREAERSVLFGDGIPFPHPPADKAGAGSWANGLIVDTTGVCLRQAYIHVTRNKDGTQGRNTKYLPKVEGTRSLPDIPQAVAKKAQDLRHSFLAQDPNAVCRKLKEAADDRKKEKKKARRVKHPRQKQQHLVHEEELIEEMLERILAEEDPKKYLIAPISGSFTTSSNAK